MPTLFRIFGILHCLSFLSFSFTTQRVWAFSTFLVWRFCNTRVCKNEKWLTPVGECAVCAMVGEQMLRMHYRWNSPQTYHPYTLNLQILRRVKAYQPSTKRSHMVWLSFAKIGFFSESCSIVSLFFCDHEWKKCYSRMVTDSNIIYYYMLFTQQKYGKKGKGTKINHSISIPFAFHFKRNSGRCRWNGVFLRLNVNV